MSLDHELIHSTRLENGVLVITEEVPGLESVAFGVWTDAGSAEEEPARYGLAHFLEHMIFKGTSRRSAFALAEEIEDVGGQLNAYTEREMTNVYARVLPEHLPVAVDLLSDMLCDSVFPPDELEREQQVVLEEIRKYEAVPEERIQDLIMEGLWAVGGLGHAILGTEESMAAITREDLFACWRRHFAANRVLVTTVGAVAHDEVVSLVERAFAHLPPAMAPLPPAPMGDRLDYLIEEEDEEQVNFCWGGRSYPAGDDRNYALAVLDATFGASTTSRLFQEIREKRGLAYDIGSEAVGFRHTGLIDATGACRADSLATVLTLMRGEIERLRREGITIKELDRARAQMKVGLALSQESTLDRMRRLATHQFIWGKIVPLRTLIQHLEQVTLPDIEQIIDDILTPADWSFTAIGPVEWSAVEGIVR